MLTDWIVWAARALRFPGADHLDPRRRAAHRRHHLLHRDLADDVERTRRPAPGAGAHARHRRHRRRGGERAAGSRPHGGQRLRHARPHLRDRIDQPLLRDGREDRDGATAASIPTVCRKVIGEHARARAAARHGRAGAAKRLDRQRRDARRHRRRRGSCRSRSRFSRRRSAPTARRSTAICAASAPVSTPRAPKQRAGRSPPPKSSADMTLGALETEVAETIPAGSAADRRSKACAGSPPIRSAAYARLYLDRLADRVADERPTPAALLSETARHLAVRMSYEDVVRVAQAKIAPARMARIAREELERRRRAVHGARFPQARHRGNVPVAAAVAGAADPALCGAQRGWLGRVYFGMEINSHLGQRLPAVLDARQAARACARAATATSRSSARSRPGSALIVAAARTLRRPRARDRRMRPPDQGLWRHPRARQRQLPHHRRGAVIRPVLGGRDRAAARRRRDRQRAHRRAGRPRGRKPRQMPRRIEWAAAAGHCCRITRINSSTSA